MGAMFGGSTTSHALELISMITEHMFWNIQRLVSIVGATCHLLRLPLRASAVWRGQKTFTSIFPSRFT